MGIIPLTFENFEDEVLRAEGPVLVEFGAPWCAYCRRLMPMLDRLTEKEGFVPIKTVNIDELPELAEFYGVRYIPTILLFKNGGPGAPLIAPGSQYQVEAFVADETRAFDDAAM